MEFLVEFEVNIPDAAPAGEVEVRETAEASAAARALGLYRADSEAQLSGLLAAVPLYDWMSVTVTPLEPHPNDPVPEATLSAAARSQP